MGDLERNARIPAQPRHLVDGRQRAGCVSAVVRREKQVVSAQDIPADAQLLFVRHAPGVFDAVGHADSALVHRVLYHAGHLFDLLRGGSRSGIAVPHQVPQEIVSDKKQIVDRSALQAHEVFHLGRLLPVAAAVAADRRRDPHAQHAFGDIPAFFLREREILLMHMDIDKAGRNHLSGRVDCLCRFRQICSDLYDLPVFDADVRAFPLSVSDVRDSAAGDLDV